MRNILIFIVSVSLLLSGCSEKPERKAAKEVRKSADKARKVISDGRVAARRIMREDSLAAAANSDIEDIARKSQEEFSKAQKLIGESFETARIEIENSIRKNTRQAGLLVTPALVISGNNLFSQALFQQSSLAAFGTPIDSLINDISNKVLAIGDLATSAVLREKLIKANEKELNGLRAVLDQGTDSYPGLKKQLKTEQKKLVAIDRKLQGLEAAAKKAEAMANKIEKSAAKKLRAAEGLSGDEKLTLQNEAYDLRLSKQEYSMKLQSANDEIAVFESQVSIIAPMISKLVNDIKSVEKTINDTIHLNGNAKLLADIREIKSKSNEHATSIQQSLGGINSALMGYLASMDGVTALLDQAMEQYKSVKSNSGREMAKSRLAACLLWKASVYAESMRLQKNLTFRVKSVMATADSAMADKLGLVVEKVSTAADEYGAKSLENYDLAIAEYENVSGSGEFDCAVRKSQILALYGKIALAEFLGDTAMSDEEIDKAYAIADATAEKAEELIEKAKECDPLFAKSITVRLVGGEIDYTPKLRVDLAGYYEEIRKDFQSWNKLKGGDKETEVNRLLAVLQGMMPAEDMEAFEKVLGPELEQLKAAKKKGFDEDYDFGVDDFGSAGADPNY